MDRVCESYAVIAAHDGTEAVSKYALEKDRIVLVLTDMMIFSDGHMTIKVH